MKSTVKRLVSATAAAALSLGIAAGAQAASHSETFKIGVVTFLSGGAAESFGVPAWNGGGSTSRPRPSRMPTYRSSSCASLMLHLPRRQRFTLPNGPISRVTSMVSTESGAWKRV